MNNDLKVAVIGIKGIPAQYGGFETCVHETGVRLASQGVNLTVYCRKNFTAKELSFFVIDLMKQRKILSKKSSIPK